MPTPRYLHSVEATPAAPRATGRTEGDPITQEAIEAIAPEGKYIIRCVATPHRGKLSAEVGDVVDVQWKRGVPFMILNFAFRKGSGHDTVSAAGGVIEQLFIAVDPKTKRTDVFFRNADQVTALNLAKLVPDITPTAVRWGDGTKNFLVFNDVAEHVYVFRLNRTPEKVMRPGQRAVAGLLQRLDLTKIKDYFTASVTFSGAAAYEVPFQPFMADFTASFDAFGATYLATVRPIPLNSYTDMTLDARGHVLLVLNLDAGGHITGPHPPSNETNYDGVAHFAAGVVDVTAGTVLVNNPVVVGRNANPDEPRRVVYGLQAIKTAAGQFARVVEKVEDHGPGFPSSRYTQTVKGPGIATLTVADSFNEAASSGFGIVDWNFSRVVWLSPTISGADVKMTDLVTGTTGIIDRGAAQEPGVYGWRNRYKLLRPDFLYDYDETPLPSGKKKDPFMLVAWDRKTQAITLDASKPDFPAPFRDKVMDKIVTLKKLPKDISLPGPTLFTTKMSLQLVNDKVVLGAVRRSFKER